MSEHDSANFQTKVALLLIKMPKVWTKMEAIKMEHHYLQSTKRPGECWMHPQRNGAKPQLKTSFGTQWLQKILALCTETAHTVTTNLPITQCNAVTHSPINRIK